MKKLVIFLSLLILVFCMSGCTIGKLDEIPPRAMDPAFLDESVDKGTELGNLTANYFWDVLGVFDIERKSGGELGKEIGEEVPNSSEVAEVIKENSPTEQEVKEEVWNTSDYLKSVIGEVFNNLGEELSNALDNDKNKVEKTVPEEAVIEEVKEEVSESSENTEVPVDRGTGDFD